MSPKATVDSFSKFLHWQESCCPLIEKEDGESKRSASCLLSSKSKYDRVVARALHRVAMRRVSETTGIKYFSFLLLM
jgi:hypothetical protein